jgi:hypothetical protein
MGDSSDQGTCKTPTINHQSRFVDLFYAVTYANVWKDGKLIPFTPAADVSSCCCVSSSDSKSGSEESISRESESEVSFNLEAEV